MNASVVRTSFVVLCAVLAGSIGHGQPASTGIVVSGVRPYYTAFPDIKSARRAAVVKNADGVERVVIEQGKEIPFPKVPAVAAGADPLRKVQYEQVQEGLDYLARMKEIARLGAEDPKDVQPVALVAAEVCLVAAELEDAPAKRVAWFEARVRVLKDGEESVTAYVMKGNLPVSALHGARFARLRAEADLLRLKADIEKAEKPKK